MNLSILDKNSVLVLNSLFQPIGTISPKKALIALNSMTDMSGNYAAKAIDVTYARNPDGTLNLDAVETFTSYTFEEWLMVDMRGELDTAVHTAKLSIRCPTVIITNYSKMPMRKFRATKALLYDMQKGVCGYSGKKLPPKKMNVEHKVPKSKGGKDTFENLMVVDAEINSKRGNKPLEEVGLKPLFHHKEPRPLPASYTIKHAIHPDWRYFLSR